MNADRRVTAQVCIALLEECNHTGLIGDSTHLVLTDAIKSLTNAEYWQLKNQERHEGKNASTDTQLAICRVALPALESAKAAWDNDDFDAVIMHLKTAVTTNGKKPLRKKSLRKSTG